MDENKEKKKLTAKEEMFCNEWLVDFNATQAAIKAGYSKHTAAVIGYENLRKPYIKARIDELTEDRLNELGINKLRILEEYSRIAYLDIRKLYDEDGNLKPIHELDDDTARAIAGIEVTIAKGEKGNDETRKVRIIDKRGALDSTAKYLGMLTDKIDVTSKGKELTTPSTVNVIIKGSKSKLMENE